MQESERTLVSSSSATPWEVLESISVSDVYRRRLKTLQCCLVHLKGRFRQVAELALEARLLAFSREDVTKETQSWKLFCLLPCWLLRRPQCKGRVGKAELSRRFDQFENGQWATLHEAADRGVLLFHQCHHAMTLEQKAKAPEQRVREGEVSRARQCLTGAALAPGNDATFQEMQRRRPQALGRPLPEEVLDFEPDIPIQLDRST